MSAWAETTCDADVMSFASALHPLHLQQVEAEASVSLAQQQFVLMWRRLLDHERERDSLKKVADKNQANVEKIETKLASASASKRPGLEQKLAQAQQLRDEANAAYAPVAARVAEETHTELAAGYAAFNNAYIQYLETALAAARSRDQVISQFASGSMSSNTGIRGAVSSAAAYIPGFGSGADASGPPAPVDETHGPPPAYTG